MSNFVAMVLTIISGVIVFFVCEILRELWLVPLHDFYTIKSKIASSLWYHARCYKNPIGMENEQTRALYEVANAELRQMACDLRGFTESLHLKVGIPSKQALFEASKLLIGLSNNMYLPNGAKCDEGQADQNEERVKEICKALGIYAKYN